MSAGFNLRLAALALAVTALAAALAPAMMLWDWDEGFYARTAAEMLRSGNFILPTFNGEVFAHKTPLGYWLMAASMAALGETAFAARLPSALALGLAVWITARTGRLILSEAAGLRAGLYLGTALMPLYLGMSAMLDAPLLVFICLGFHAWARLLTGAGGRGLSVAFFGLAMLGGALAKGPVGPAVLLGALALTLALLPRTARPTRATLAALAGATALAFAGFLAWAVPSVLQSGGAMLAEGVGVHIIGRALAPMEGHGGAGIGGYLATLPVYVPVVFLGFLPWTLHLPAGLAALASGRLADPVTRAILWGGLVPTFVLFTLAATKLPHYVLPLFPSLALVAAGAVVAGPVPRFWRHMGQVLLALLGGGLALALAWAAAAELGSVPPVGGAVALLLLVVIIRGIWGCAAGPRNDTALALGWAGVMAGFYWLVMPPVEAGLKLTREIGGAIATHATPDTRLYKAGFTEPSLVFYARQSLARPIRRLPTDQAALDALMTDPAPMLAVLTEEALATLEARAAARPFTILRDLEAANVNNSGRRERVLLVSRPALGEE